MNAIRLVSRTMAETAAEAFSGVGGLYNSGRWHVKGLPIVYAASTLPLAALERLVHFKRTTKIVEHVFYEIDVPDEFIEAPVTMPSGWNGEAPAAASQGFGSRWLRENRSVGLCVPSAIIPTHKNLLLNPWHPDFSLKWVTSGPHPFRFDPRLVASGSAKS